MACPGREARFVPKLNSACQNLRTWPTFLHCRSSTGISRGILRTWFAPRHWSYLVLAGWHRNGNTRGTISALEIYVPGPHAAVKPLLQVHFLCSSCVGVLPTLVLKYFSTRVLLVRHQGHTQRSVSVPSLGGGDLFLIRV